MADGEVTIDALLSTDKFDRQIAELEKKINKEEKNKINIETKLDTQTQQLEEQRKKTDELADAYQRLNALKEKAESGKATYQDFSAIQNLEAQYGTLEKIDGAFQKSLDKQDQMEMKVADTKLKYEDLNSKVTEYQSKINNLKLEKHKADIDKVKGKFNDVGSSIQNTVYKVGRLALGVIGIRTAMMGLRRMSSELATYDKQYATNLEYLRFVLAQAIAPVLRGIVSLAMTLMNIINAIVSTLFGFNLFSNASVKDFENMKKSTDKVNKNLGGAGKAIKDMKKQLAGFDEANILQEDGDTSGGGGGGGLNLNDFTMPDINAEHPEWMEWILHNAASILGFFAGLKTALDLIGLGVNKLKALGVGLVIWGVIEAIEGLVQYFNDPSFKNLAKVLKGIGIAILGVAAIIGSVPVAIAGAIVLIVALIMRHWEKIRETIQNGINWLVGIGDFIKNNINANLGNMFNRIVHILQDVLNWFDRTFKNIKTIFDGLINFIKGIFTGNWQQAWESIKQIFIGAFKAMADTGQLVIDLITDLVMALGNFIAAGVDGLKIMFKEAWDYMANGAMEAWQSIQKTFSTVADFFGKIFSDAWTRVKNVFSTGGVIFNGIKDGIVSAFKRIVNSIISGINRVISVPFNSINSVLRAIKNVSIAGMKPFDWVWTISVPQIPYLKTGGIINLPGRGVNLGGAFGGEAGREGVLPLTDQQAMAQLGREIGKWIVVNATITNSMNGRLISREIKKIENEQEFAFNN